MSSIVCFRPANLPRSNYRCAQLLDTGGSEHRVDLNWTEHCAPRVALLGLATEAYDFVPSVRCPLLATDGFCDPFFREHHRLASVNDLYPAARF